MIPGVQLVGLLTAVSTSTASASPSACRPMTAHETVLLVVMGVDPELKPWVSRVDEALRKAAPGALNLLPKSATERALRMEGGHERRSRTLLEARVLIDQAEERFRELDDELALELIAKATARLASVHQEPGATEVLATAHLLAGAIYLARDRVDAARQRLRRALDFNPKLAPPRHRFSRRVAVEVAAIQGLESARPVGRLEVRLHPNPGKSTVYLDGHRLGQTPLWLHSVGVGRHLLRVSKEGYQSDIRTIQVEPEEPTRLSVRLVPDAELVRIRALPRLVRAEHDLEPVLELLAKRADANRVLLAGVRLGTHRSVAGTVLPAVSLFLSGGGSQYVARAEADDLGRGLGQAMACHTSGEKPPDMLPSMLGAWSAQSNHPEPVPKSPPFWSQPWFWAVTAVATIGLSAALVTARTSGGPPSAVNLRIVPRP